MGPMIQLVMEVEEAADRSKHASLQAQGEDDERSRSRATSLPRPTASSGA